VINIPVAPGRNVATLIEVAARIQLLRNRGYTSSMEYLYQQDNGKKGEAND
jgi:serine kinase of HPr protein (carbohydrate metabolism regulator)